MSRIKKASPQDKPETEQVIMERMNEALKRMMKTPHETQKEMIERRRRVEVKSKPKR